VSAIERLERDDVVVLKQTRQTLHPRAIELAADAFARRPAVNALYSDVVEGGAIWPRPGWDGELAAWWDLAAPPVFLRAGSYGAGLDARAVVADILETQGEAAVGRLALPLASQAERHRPPLAPVPAPRLARTPRVSAIIPTKFRVDLLESCLKGLVEATGYPDLETVIVDNGCKDPRFAAVLDAAGAELDITRVEDFGAFNFPRLIASGAAQATGEVLLLLNDDIEPTQTGWLHRMVDSAMRQDVGAVGARLLFPDGSVQHAGAILGIGGVCGHMWKGASPDEQARNPYIAYPGQRMAVTGACLAVRRDVFDQVGGLDAAAFPVALNDIDFCLRLRAAGYRTLYRGDAVLIHHESQSRGTDDANEARRKRLEVETGRFLQRWRSQLADDPFGSPAFDPVSESGLVHRSLRRPPDP
jgi:GT2 family glycosyltransferase